MDAEQHKKLREFVKTADFYVVWGYFVV